MNSFMPTGRTALVRSGDAHLQVQTEYAYRPFPRITTTISSNGQVIHKLEKKLDRPVESAEEQTKIESYIKKQHQVVLDTIKESSSGNQSKQSNQSSQAKAEPSVKAPTPTPAPVKAEPEKQISVREKLTVAPGYQSLFRLDKVGNFLDRGADQNFRGLFPKEYKSLRDLLEIFPINASGVRDTGVCEIQRDRLYLISCGEDFYLVEVRRTNVDTKYEKYFKKLIASPEEQLFLD